MFGFIQKFADTAVAAMAGVALGKLAVPEKKDQLYLLGNEAAALGAISAGPVLWLLTRLLRRRKLWNI